MNSKPAFYPGETVKSRMSADERLNLELAREMKWYERTGRTDHLPGEIRHTRYQDGVPVETKILPPLDENKPLEGVPMLPSQADIDNLHEDEAMKTEES